MPHNVLAEVFGYPAENLSEEAERVRERRGCPFRNKGPNCTKDKKNDPLGTCSIMDGDLPTITCPVRFTEDWLVAYDAAKFFGFPNGSWHALREVRLNDRNGRSAGNIDLVIVSYDGEGLVQNFGMVEIQAVYISGNVRRPFAHYMEDRADRKDYQWVETPKVRPDYLSSSRKRLMPQLVYKGGILRAWDKKIAVALHRRFFDTLPKPETVSKEEAEIAWLVYDVEKDATANRYNLVLDEVVYTVHEPDLLMSESDSPGVGAPAVGSAEDFKKALQEQMDEGLHFSPTVL